MNELSYEQMLEASAHFIRTHDDFVIVSHLNPDGDAISSTCAVGWLLSQLGKRYIMVNEDTIPDKFEYLPGVEALHRFDAEAYRVFDQGAIISVDCADFSRIGAPSALFKNEIPFLNIDHHPTNDFFGDTHLIRTDAAATAEILFELIQHLGLTLDGSVSNALYTGIMTDTGGFRYSNTTPNVMQMAATLIASGAQGHILAEKLLESMTYSQLELLKRSLNNLHFREDKRVAWMSVSLADIAATAAVIADLEGLVNYARNVEGVEVGLLFKQQADNAYKVSFRSAGLVDVASIAKSFGGGGHKRAAGASLEGSLEEVQTKVLSAIARDLP
jgi:phosphoesterase RecJ-like protein